MLLERYELREALGRGGMATVYRALDRQLGRFVAVKLFASGTAVDDARRRAEATMLARLSHPNLVTLHDAHLAGVDDDTPSFLVMELIEGTDLRTRLDDGPLTGVEAAELAAEIAEGLVVVHDAGMVHRDLKPANILLPASTVPGGRLHAKLADFGIAHLLGAERLTTDGTVIGTAAYLSPEQVAGAEPDASTDVYALGLVLLEALTGRRSYPGSPVESVSARAAYDPRIPSTLPDDWRGMLAAMTARSPALRPTAMEIAVMARELAPQLVGWEASGEPDDEMPTAVMPSAGAAGASVAADAPTAVLAPPAKRRRGLLVALVAGALVVLVAGAIGLGVLFAPSGTNPSSVPSTPSPTTSTPASPSVAPTVAPVTTTDPAPAPAPAPAPSQKEKGNPGKGKGNGPGNGPGKGKDKSQER
ncbi:serine/threonine protein kinase [Leifsonia sp. PS1209]|nr:serine/threonine protein kinase [Leifsonia sp. PS1209]